MALKCEAWTQFGWCSLYVALVGGALQNEATSDPFSLFYSSTLSKSVSVY